MPKPATKAAKPMNEAAKPSKAAKAAHKVDWTALEINSEALEESWTRSIAREGFRTWLLMRSRRSIADICQVLGLNIDEKEEKHELVQRLTKERYDRDAFFAKAFLRSKTSALQEYLTSSDSELFTRLRNLSPLASVLSLARDDLGHLISVEILARWINRPAGPQYQLGQPVTQADVDTLCANTNDLAGHLDERSAELGKHASPDTCYRIGSTVLLGVNRQTGDRLVRELGGRRRSRPSSLGFVRLREGDSKLELRNLSQFEDVIVDWVRDSLGTIKQVSSGLFDAFEEETFQDRLLRPLAALDEDRSPITRLAARTSLTIGQSQIQVQSSDKRSDIRNDLQSLVDSKSLRFNEPSDIDSLDLMFDGRPIPVKIRIDKEKYTCRADPDDKRLTDEQRLRLSQQFELSLGFPLDTPVARGDTAINRAWAFDRLLSTSAPMMDQMAAPFRKDLMQLGVASEEELFHWKCKEGHEGRSEETPERCGFCNSEEMKVVTEVAVVVDRDELEEMILRAIGTIPEVVVQSGTIERTVAGQKHELTVLDVSGQVAYLFFAYGPVSVRFLRLFERATSTLLIVRIGLDGTTSRRLQDSLYAEVSAGEILAETLVEGKESVPPEVTKRVKSMRRIAGELRMRAARQSESSLQTNLGQPTDAYKTDFEIDIFNLFGWWMEIAERWGAATIGKAVPEAVGAWSVRQPNVQNFSLAWDCKWNVDGTGFNFTAPEKRKASDYIGRLREQPHFQVFSGDLTGYALISNKFRPAQFEAVANKCIEENPTWNGHVLFIDVDAISTVYDAFMYHYDDLLPRLSYLRKGLSKVLFTAGVRWLHVTKQEVDECVAEVLTLPIPQNLEIADLRVRLTK